MEQKTKNKPVFKATAGGVNASVWKQEGQHGEYHTVTLQRSYKDKEDKWQHTGTLRTNDLPNAILALAKCFEHLKLKTDKTE